MSDTIGGVIKWIIIIVVIIFLFQHFNILKKQAGSVIWSSTNKNTCETDKAKTQSQGNCVGNCVQLTNSMVNCLGFGYATYWAYYWNYQNINCDGDSIYWKCLYSPPTNCDKKADTNCDNNICFDEILSYVQKWVSGTVIFDDALSAVQSWTAQTTSC